MKFIYSVFLPHLLTALFLLSGRTDAQPRVELIIEPGEDRIAPDRETVKFTLKLSGISGEPVPSARIKAALKSPKRGRFFSTDFPWVEDSTLLDMDAALTNGSFSFDYLIPIRGTYALRAKVFLKENAPPIEEIFTLNVRENPDEVKKLSLLIGILFAVGFFAGIFFRRSKTASAAVFLLIAFVPSPLHAHKAAHGGVKGSAQKSFSVKQEGRTLSVTLKPDHGIVGKLTCIQAAITDNTGNNVSEPAYFEINLANAEDNARVFDSVIFAPEGKTMQCVQTTDGANHILSLQAFDEDPKKSNAGAKPIAAFKKEIEVESFAPPKIVVAKTLGFFLAIMAFGVFTGSLVEGLRKPQ